MARKTLWVNERGQIEAVAHPARHEIVDRLVALGPMGARELSSAIGRKITTVYHHLQLLEKVGLIEPASVEIHERGRPYVVYRAKAPRIRLNQAALDPKLRQALGKWARVVGLEAARQFSGALGEGDAKFTGTRRNMWLFRVVCAPSPANLRRINQLLEELSDLVWAPDPKPGPLISIGWFMSPLDREQKSPRRKQKKPR